MSTLQHDAQIRDPQLRTSRLRHQVELLRIVWKDASRFQPRQVLSMFACEFDAIVAILQGVHPKFGLTFNAEGVHPVGPRQVGPEYAYIPDSDIISVWEYVVAHWDEFKSLQFITGKVES